MKASAVIRVWLLALILSSGVYAMAEEAVEAEAPRSESEWIAVLEAESTWHEKQLACRALRQIGTEASVPALATLLQDPELAGLARFALEAMPYPEAGAAFREALHTTQGSLLAGVIISLGVRKDGEAVAELIPLLDAPDPDVAAAAAGALGRIGTIEATDALLARADQADGAQALALGEALLAAGEQLQAAGQLRRTEEVYESLLQGDWAAHIQMGAFQGLCTVRPRQASRRLLQALEGNDPVFRDMAAQIIGEGSDTGDTRRFARALGGLPVEGQLALLRGLAVRQDPEARNAVVGQLNNADPRVQLSALAALGALGNVADVPVLIEGLDHEDSELALAARTSLRRLQNGNVNGAIIEAMADASPSVRVILLELVAERLATETVEVAVKALDDPDESIRLTALQILSISGGSQEAPDLIRILVQTDSGEERSGANRALGIVSAREGDAVLPILLQALDEAPPQPRQTMIRNLAQIRNADALEALLQLVDDEEDDIQNEARRVLGNWPTQDAAPHLLAMATEGDGRVRDTGLRGYVRLARENRDLEARSEMLRNAAALIQRKEEAWLVLGGWGTVHTPEALNEVLPYLRDEETANEAASALIAIAERIAGSSDENKVLARQALEAILAANTSDAVQERAAALQAGLAD